MKVLHIVGFHPQIGGPYYSVKELARSIHKLGCRVGVCSVVPDGFDETKLDDISYLDDIIYLKSSRILSVFWPSYTNELKNFIEKIKDYDIIHINGVFDYYSYFVYKNIHKPFIITPRGTLIEDVLMKKYIRKKFFLRFIGERILKSARVVHVLTPDEKIALKKLGVDERLIQIIPNGINPEGFNLTDIDSNLCEKYPELLGKRLVLFLSRINWKKGLDDLIPAFSYVVKKVKEAHLLLAGPDNEGYLKRVMKWIKDYSLNESVTYIGPVYGRDKVMVLRDSEIFVLPSYSEGFPVSVIEAMYMKLPVVVTKTIGIQDIIENTKCGIVVNRSRSEIANAIIALLENKNLCIEMGKRGRRCIEENFLWDNIAKKMLELYEDVINGVY